MLAGLKDKADAEIIALKELRDQSRSQFLGNKSRNESNRNANSVPSRNHNLSQNLSRDLLLNHRFNQESNLSIGMINAPSVQSERKQVTASQNQPSTAKKSKLSLDEKVESPSKIVISAVELEND